MITEEQFYKYLDAVRKTQIEVSRIESVVNVSLLEAPVFDGPYTVFDLFIDSHFDEVGRDSFYAWFYENENVFDSTKICTDEQMWEFLKNHIA